MSKINSLDAILHDVILDNPNNSQSCRSCRYSIYHDGYWCCHEINDTLTGTDEGLKTLIYNYLKANSLKEEGAFCSLYEQENNGQ